eukprot:SAG31_NODE_6317_length_2068_cov_1.582529_3_plen_249_part_00
MCTLTSLNLYTAMPMNAANQPAFPPMSTIISMSVHWNFTIKIQSAATACSFWPEPGEVFHDSSAGKVAEDTGLDSAPVEWSRITAAYNANMDALRDTTLRAGKFAWQLLWTGGPDDNKGSTQTHPIVTKQSCSTQLRALCSNATAPPQTRAMMYALNTGDGHDPSVLPDLEQDLANFLLVRGDFAWLGHGWKGCSKQFPFPKQFNLDYGEPLELCKETAPNSNVWSREWTKASVSMDCNTWTPTIKLK